MSRVHICVTAIGLMTFMAIPMGALASPTSSEIWTIQGAVGCVSAYGADKNGALAQEMGLTHSFAHHWAVRCGLIRLKYRSGDQWGAGFTGAAFGPRVYLQGQPFGVFIEALPAVFLAEWFDDASGKAATRIVAGFQEGLGFGVPLSARIGTEFGVQYLVSVDGVNRLVRDGPQQRFEGLGQSILYGSFMITFGR